MAYSMVDILAKIREELGDPDAKIEAEWDYGGTLGILSRGRHLKWVNRERWEELGLDQPDHEEHEKWVA